MTRLRVTSLDAIPDGSGLRIEAAGQRVALLRSGDRVYAVGDRCSHAEASLAEGLVLDGTVECPRHGAVFDLCTGEARSMPATRPVPVYPVEVSDGEVFVDFPAPEEAP
jgi:3-phenylpropionate/trans-cinnamate dioxygenase ferredoxin component